MFKFWSIIVFSRYQVFEILVKIVYGNITGDIFTFLFREMFMKSSWIMFAHVIHHVTFLALIWTFQFRWQFLIFGLFASKVFVILGAFVNIKIVQSFFIFNILFLTFIVEPWLINIVRFLAFWCSIMRTFMDITMRKYNFIQQRTKRVKASAHSFKRLLHGF